MSDQRLPLHDLSTFTRSAVMSTDGTQIGYQSIGTGPGIIVVHAALRDSNDYTQLAITLSQTFTVHLMDRRGRGMSGPQGADYTISKEYEDVQAVRQATGANYLFGHSYGGFVALEVARKDSSITKLALYEPGVLVEPMDDSWMSEYEKAMQRNDLWGAFTHFVRGIDGSPLRRLPFWYAKFILRVMIRRDHWDKTAHLLVQNLVEHRELQHHASSYSNYRSVEAVVLLMSGSKSPNSFQEVFALLNSTIAHSELVTVSKLNHFGPENENGPSKVAQVLNGFYHK